MGFQPEVREDRPPSASQEASPSRGGPLTVIVACAFFMEMLDSTVIVTALPQMAESFGTEPVDLSLGLSAYLLALAIFVPASGWIAGRFGARSVLCTAILLFTAASAGCGLSHTLWQFVLARILQGVGASLMSPVGRIAVLRITEKKDLVRTLNFLTFPGLIGPLLGPPLGGFITTYGSWRWIFYLNLPFGLIGALLILRFLGRAASNTPPRRFDGIGFLLNGTSLAAILYGLEMAGRPASDRRLGLALAAAGAALAAFTWRRAIRHPHPLIDLSARLIPTYLVANAGGTLFRLAVAAPIFLLPLFLQLGLGMSAFTAGLLILGHTAGDFGTSAVTTRTIRRFGFRTVLITTALAFGAAIAACTLLEPGTTYWMILILLLATGICRSLHMAALSSLQFADIPAPLIADTSTLSTMLQQVTRGVAIAFAAILLTLAMALRGGDRLEMSDFRVALLVTACIACASVVSYLRLHGTTASEVSGHRPIGDAQP
jgi:EmrB/QacA subfamily drug resistance transporter